MKKIESFPSEALLIKKIDDYLAQGVKEDQLTVIANSDLRKLKAEYKGITNKTKEMSPWQNFLSILSMKSWAEKEIDKLDLNEDERYVCRKELEDNQIVLYVGGI